MSLQRLEKYAYFFALGLVVYMPLHIFLSQSLSLVTGGLEVWKAAKDVVLVVAVFPLLFVAYKQGLFANKKFKTVMAFGAAYVAIYMLFILFDKNADAVSAITASVYNTRILGYLLLGSVVAASKNSDKYTKTILKTLLVMCGVVAAFGVLQYVLPKDLLTHVGYSVERGVKPMFFIDDKPDFPRVMSTLRDPNSLGAFMAFPIMYATYYLFMTKKNDAYKVLSTKWLRILLPVCALCLLLTFSRSGLVTLFGAITALVFVATKNKKAVFIKYLPIAITCAALAVGLFMVFKDSYVFKNLVLHSDESSAQLDPNELRLSFGQKAIDHIKQYPQGEGPGTAGLVAISNSKGGVLTENYYLQIAYEVGLAGLLLFVAIYGHVLVSAYKANVNGLHRTVFACGVGIAFFGLLNHSWSNEALALQWWLLAGVVLVFKKPKTL